MTPVNYNNSLLYMGIVEKIRKAANDSIYGGYIIQAIKSNTPAAVIINEISMMIQDNRSSVVGILNEDIVKAIEGLKLVHPKCATL